MHVVHRPRSPHSQAWEIESIKKNFCSITPANWGIQLYRSARTDEISFFHLASFISRIYGHNGGNLSILQPK